MTDITHRVRDTPDANDVTDGGASRRACIAERLANVRGEVARAARASGRSPEDVTIVAVSKTWDAHTIALAAEAGQRQFGESRAQELRDKQGSPPLDRWKNLAWHFVGRLQTNKVKYVVGSCAMVHSVDRWDLAQALHERADFDGSVVQALVQVNVDDDPSKAGLLPEAVPAFVERCTTLSALRIRGLMTIPALGGDARPAFQRLRDLRDAIRADHPRLVELSMGMSADYADAVAQGATIIRPGQAIFGPRAQP